VGGDEDCNDNVKEALKHLSDRANEIDQVVFDVNAQRAREDAANPPDESTIGRRAAEDVLRNGWWNDPVETREAFNPEEHGYVDTMKPSDP
jgi:hypothetical protein